MSVITLYLIITVKVRSIDKVALVRQQQVSSNHTYLLLPL